MNENIDLIEILKDCPKGTPLYCPMFGEVMLAGVGDKYEENYPIAVTCDNDSYSFTSDGKYYECKAGECLLFPSKENRDWSTFKISKKEYKFKPFERVLVRDFDNQFWTADIFSHLDVDNEYACVGGVWTFCIPYKGNEHLIGTDAECK